MAISMYWCVQHLKLNLESELFYICQHIYINVLVCATLHVESELFYICQHICIHAPCGVYIGLVAIM
jgi:hypothetical protein